MYVILRRIFYIYGDTGRRDPGRISGKTGGDQPKLYEYGDGDPVSRGCGADRQG